MFKIIICMTFAMLSVVWGTHDLQGQSLGNNSHNLPAPEIYRVTFKDATLSWMSGDKSISDCPEVKVEEWMPYLQPYISYENPEVLEFDPSRIEVPLYLGSILYQARTYEPFNKLHLSVGQQCGEVVFNLIRTSASLPELLRSEAALTEPNTLIQMHSPFAPTLREALNKKAAAMHIPPLFEPGMNPLGTGHTPEALLLALAEARSMAVLSYAVGVALYCGDPASRLPADRAMGLELQHRTILCLYLTGMKTREFWRSPEQKVAYMRQYSFNIMCYFIWSDLPDRDSAQLEELRQECDRPHILREYMSSWIPKADWPEAEAYYAQLRADYEARNRDQHT